MTQLEYIDKMAEIDEKFRNMKKNHEVQMNLIEMEHRDNVQNEREHYEIAKRRQKAEYDANKAELQAIRHDVIRSRAITREQEEKRAIGNACEG